MKRNVFIDVTLAGLTIVVILLLVWTSSATREVGALAVEIARMKDSLALMGIVVDSLRMQIPGLGEYMSTMQLHTAKLWFAGQASNWKLAGYELDELGETMEAAGQLRARKNAVDITGVLQSVRRTQLPLLLNAITNHDLPAFRDAYALTLAACNGCHRPAGYEFIHIITPTQEPVTNQQWKADEP